MVDEGLRVFEMMKESGVGVNEVTMIAVFGACAKKGDLELGRSVHDYVEKMSVNKSLNLMNSVLDMYVKCGCLVTAKEVFEGMRIRDVFSWTSMINGYAKNGELIMAKKMFDEMPERNVVSWNAMIAGYSQNNKPKEAIDLFHEMENVGLVPIETTLVCVLSACAQAGCLELGRWMYSYYVKRNRIQLTVTLGNAFIDMYAKCGNIDAAVELFNEMGEKDLVSWNSMIVGFASHGHAVKVLNACRMHGNLELGKLATEKLIELDPNDSGIYVLMESLCAARSKWDEVKMVRSMMRGNGVKKTPGRSSIEVEGEFHEFLAADKSHPLSERIYKVLGEIISLSRLEDASDANRVYIAKNDVQNSLELISID